MPAFWLAYSGGCHGNTQNIKYWQRILPLCQTAPTTVNCTGVVLLLVVVVEWSKMMIVGDEDGAQSLEQSDTSSRNQREAHPNYDLNN